MAKQAAAGRIKHVSQRELQKLDARLRARELRARAAGRKALRPLLDPSNPRLKVSKLYS